jgi:hypothetical protein
MSGRPYPGTRAAHDRPFGAAAVTEWGERGRGVVVVAHARSLTLRQQEAYVICFRLR